MTRSKCSGVSTLISSRPCQSALKTAVGEEERAGPRAVGVDPEGPARDLEAGE